MLHRPNDPEAVAHDQAKVLEHRSVEYVRGVPHIYIVRSVAFCCPEGFAPGGLKEGGDVLQRGVARTSDIDR